MGNHTIECKYCEVDLRTYGHEGNCPVPAYECAVEQHQRDLRGSIERDYKVNALRKALREAEWEAEEEYLRYHPRPKFPSKK